MGPWWGRCGRASGSGRAINEPTPYHQLRPRDRRRPEPGPRAPAPPRRPRKPPCNATPPRHTLRHKTPAQDIGIVRSGTDGQRLASKEAWHLKLQTAIDDV